MIHPIVRLYDTAAQVTEVLGALAAEGISADLITTVAPTAGATQDSIAKTIAAAYVLTADAAHFAQSVLQGRTAVIVRAVFGTGGKVEKILDAYQPAPSPVQHAPDWADLWDPATPISSALRAPLLSKGSFSSFWSLPLLTRHPLRLPFPELTESRSKTVLSANPAPLSALLRLPLLL